MSAARYPTSVQYALGVAVGHAVVGAAHAGASYDEIIATLRHSIRNVEMHKTFQLELGGKQDPDLGPVPSAAERRR